MDFQSEMRSFFNPRAVGVVGVSRDPWKFGSVMLRRLKKFGSTIPIYPVSNRLTELDGLKVFPSISALPDGVDLVILCLPAALTPEAVRECSQKGIPSVIIPSGGFRETGTEQGKRLEAELRSLTGRGTRVIGPNCFGVYSPAGGLTILPGADFPRTPGSIGFFAQSGGITEDFCFLLPDYGCYASHAVSYGNACDVNEVDLARYYLADSETRIVAAYLEGVKNRKDFFPLMQKLAADKPTLIWKAGLTPTGAAAAASHTGSMAGGDAAWGAFFKQTGAIPVQGMEELLDVVSVIDHLPPTGDDRVALIAGGGGIGVAGSDACFRSGLTLSRFDDETRRKLTSILPPTGANRGNPVDSDNPFPRPSVLRGVLEAIAESRNVGSIVIDKIALSVKLRQHFGHTEEIGDSDEKDEPWLEELPVLIRKRYEMPVIVVLREGGEPLEEIACEAERRRLRKYYQENGVAVFPTAQRAFNALGKMTRYYRRMGRKQ
jgi:acyl-CoA synthetase (NDP forming)